MRMTGSMKERRSSIFNMREYLRRNAKTAVIRIRRMKPFGAIFMLAMRW